MLLSTRRWPRAVVGIPHPTHGEEVAAAVVLKPGAEATPAELQAFCRERVAAYKYPRHVWLEAALPKTATGKLLRRGGPARGPGAVSGRPPAGLGRWAPPRRRPICWWRPPRSGRCAGSCRAAPASARRRPARRPHGWHASGRPGRRTRPVGVGRSTLAPPPRDRRFTDPAWTSNPLLHRLVQAYLAAGQTAERLWPTPTCNGATPSGCGLWSTTWCRRSPLATTRSPARSSGRPWSTPAAAAWSAAPTPGRRPGHAATGANHGGRRRLRGGRRPGTDPGAVVLRGVRAAAVPAADATGASRAAAGRPADDQQVLHPGPRPGPQPGRAPGRQRPAGLRRLLAQPRRPPPRLGRRQLRAAILEALEATRRICRADRSLLLGLCSGGILAAMVLAHLAATGRQHRSPGSAWRWRCSTRPARGRPAPLDEGTARRPSRPPRRGGTWTAGPWPRCSPGCVPAT